MHFQGQNFTDDLVWTIVDVIHDENNKHVRVFQLVSSSGALNKVYQATKVGRIDQ